MTRADYLHALQELRDKYLALRNSLFKAATNADGEYPNDECGQDDQQSVAEMDRILAAADEALRALDEDRKHPDPLGEALNSGDGTWRP